jgi:hypothetical protein
MNPEIYVQLVCLGLVSIFLIRALIDPESR